MRAYRIETECPDCGRSLKVRRRRSDGEPFLACPGFPSCRYAEDVLPIIVDLEERLRQAEDDLAMARAHRHRCAATPNGVDIARELRNLVYRWHPDRHPEPIQPHDVVAELTALRARIAA